jgi:TIR domain
MAASEMKDVFVSHASEDKEEVADPLVGLLNSSRVTTWYDTTELRLGDSLLERIDDGLLNSRFGVVILSRSFFSKQWPRRELDGLFSRRTSDEKFRILPVWHNVSVEEVGQFSPILAGHVGVPTTLGLEIVANRIRETVYHRDAPHAPDEYAQVHAMKTMRLTDLPLANGWIEHQYFHKCYLTGPGVIVLNTDTLIRNCKFAEPEQFFPIRTGRRYLGMMGVRHTAFSECTFDGSVGIAVPDDIWEETQRSIGIRFADG